MSTDHGVVQPNSGKEFSMTDAERIFYKERTTVKDRMQAKIKDRLGFMTKDNPKGKSSSMKDFNLDHFLWTLDLGAKNTSNAARFDNLYQKIVSEGKIIDEDEIIETITMKLITRDRIVFKDIDGIPEFVGLKQS